MSPSRHQHPEETTHPSTAMPALVYYSRRHRQVGLIIPFSAYIAPELVTMARLSVGLNLLKIKFELLLFSPDRSKAEEELLFDSETSLFEQSCILWQSTALFLQVCLWLLEHWHSFQMHPAYHIIFFLAMEHRSKRLICDVRNQDLSRKKGRVRWQYMPMGTGLSELLVPHLTKKFFTVIAVGMLVKGRLGLACTWLVKHYNKQMGDDSKALLNILRPVI